MSNYQNIKIDALALAFKALSNPHRLRIFLGLTACCPPGETPKTDAAQCVGELGAALDIAPSTVSHHIKELAQCGLIHIERRGRNIFCHADENAVMAMQNFFKRPIVENLTEQAQS